jgi:ABC-type Mn2+/Zn2+ transport system ATPase subunit
MSRSPHQILRFILNDYGSFMTDASPLVSCKHMGCAYDNAMVLQDVDFEIGEGEFVGIVGPSGSGKTTLLRAILRTMKPVHGTITHRHGLRFAYVPQVETVDWNFPVTVMEVITMTRSQHKWWPRTSAKEKTEANAVLEQLGLSGLGGRHIRELSGGQQQRVFVARALFHQPELLVLDEPTSGVDVSTRHEVLHLLSDLHDSGVSIVLTTHDLNGLAAHLPRIVCLNKTVIADGPPSEIITPEVLEQTYGAPMEVLIHGGMPVVVDSGVPDNVRRIRGVS